MGPKGFLDEELSGPRVRGDEVLVVLGTARGTREPGARAGVEKHARTAARAADEPPARRVHVRGAVRVARLAAAYARAEFQAVAERGKEAQPRGSEVRGRARSALILVTLV